MLTLSEQEGGASEVVTLGEMLYPEAETTTALLSVSMSLLAFTDDTVDSNELQFTF